MVDDVTPTGKPKWSRKSKLYENPPPPKDFKRWWEDPSRTAWCDLLARAIVLEAVEHMRETALAAAPVKLAAAELEPAPQPTERRTRRTRRAMGVRADQ